MAGVGTVLTSASGLTLYRFTEDSPGTSMCNGACAKIWPPLLAAKGAHRFISSGDVGVFRTLGRRLLGPELDVEVESHSWE